MSSLTFIRTELQKVKETLVREKKDFENLTNKINLKRLYINKLRKREKKLLYDLIKLCTNN